MSIYVTGTDFPMLTLPPDLSQSSDSQSTDVARDVFVGEVGDARPVSRGALPGLTYTINFLLESRQKINDMIEFLNLVAGQYAPFWLPTWSDDVKVVAGGFVAMTIQYIGYTENLFPNPAYRNLLGVKYLDPTDFRFGGVGGSVDNGDGTETLSTGLGGLSGLFEYRYMFRHLVRLNSDEVEIEYLHGSAATVGLAVRHIPEEV